MSRAALTRLILALIILGGSIAFAVTKEPRLGLDLRGGVQFVLETQDTETLEADAEATDRTLEVLRGRVDALGVAEPTLTRAGENRIIVELPDLDDPTEAADVIGQTAQLSFHPVVEAVGPKAEPEKGPKILPDESGRPR
jgi:SecD/SecF fusion protein